MSKGWIKLKRSFIDWEWFSDHNASRLLIYLLCTVNYEQKKWRGITIEPGSMVLSWETLSNSVGLSIQQCRTAMSKLETSGEITRKSTNKYQVVSLVKWHKIQGSVKENNKQYNNKLTINQQSNNNQITTTKESKEYKEREEDVYTDIEILKEKYLSDPKICSAVIDNKKNKIENRGALEISLDRFNEHLKQTGQNVKPWNDYTKHFLNWQRKDKTDKGSFDAAEYIRNGISST